MKRLVSILSLSLPLFSVACGSAASSSQTKWAHTPTASSMSIINARLDYIALDFKRDFETFAICIQDATDFKGPELLLETKLAYAAWLNASGQGSDAKWQSMTFSLQTRCDMDDTNYSSIVVIGDEGKITADQEIERTFRRNKVTCTKRGLSANCSTGSMTMGIGGSGGMSYRYFKPEIWDSVSNTSPATVLLSPYVKWTSMAPDLGTSSLGTSYKALTLKADTVSYSELKTFNTLLQKNTAKLQDKDRLDAIVQEFLNSPAKSLIRDYAPVQAAYHVLLHEVGHQFGMDHADRPQADSETGTSGTATQASEDAPWVTPLSTMAYADEYLHLTADDVAGIQHLATKNAVFVKSHRGVSIPRP